MGAGGGADVGLGMLGGGVIVLCSCVDVAPGTAEVSSLHPQNRPGVMQVVVAVVVVVVVVVTLVVVLSLHPNQPLGKVSIIRANLIYFTYGV